MKIYDTIIDLCSGVGLQSIEFAKTCKKVIGVERDPRKVHYAKLNALLAKVDNVEFECADAVSEKIINLVKEHNADAIFCDPQRPPSETQRTLETIQPNMNTLVEEYSKFVPLIAVEFPPKMEEDQIPFVGEKEYLSVEGRVNRLTLYISKENKIDRSVVVLPSGDKLEPQDHSMVIAERNPLGYFFEVEPAIIRANMLPDFLQVLSTQDPQVGVCFQEKEKCLLTSKKKVNSNFLRNSYKILEVCENDTEIITKHLQDLGARDVLLRSKVDPKDYWKIRLGYMKQLKETAKDLIANLFTYKDVAYICKKL